MPGTIGKMRILLLGEVELVHGIRYLSQVRFSWAFLLGSVTLVIFQPGSPRAYDAPTPGSGWANTRSGNYNDAGTPRDSNSSYGD